MSTVLQFPSSRALAVCVERERDGLTWLVITPRGHGWLHGSFKAALDDARAVAAGFGVSVISS
jgi:hypothetical protein